MKPNLLLGYAADFVGFLLVKLTPRELPRVREIILFGSAARGEAGPQSDVDLFIDASDPKRLEPRAEAILAAFEQSVKVTDFWRLLGVHNPISLKIGEVHTWQALAPALREDGRVLYGRHRQVPPSLLPKVLLSWENIRSGTARTNLYRNLYGYVAQGKRYPGLLEQHHGERVSKGAALIPLETLADFKELFRRLQVTCRLRPLFEEVSDVRPQASKAPAARRSRSNSKPVTDGEIPEQLLLICSLLRDLLDSPEKVLHWLLSPTSAFDNTPPIELVRQGKASRLLQELRALLHGDHGR